MKPTLTRFLSMGAAMGMPLTALAHDGHGNTPLHALMHMLEQNGAAIGVLLLVGIGTLVWRAQQKRKTGMSPRSSVKHEQERQRDSR